MAQTSCMKNSQTHKRIKFKKLNLTHNLILLLLSLFTFNPNHTHVYVIYIYYICTRFFCHDPSFSLRKHPLLKMKLGWQLQSPQNCSVHPHSTGLWGHMTMPGFQCVLSWFERWVTGQGGHLSCEAGEQGGLWPWVKEDRGRKSKRT